MCFFFTSGEGFHIGCAKAKVEVNPKKRRTGEKAAANLGLQLESVAVDGTSWNLWAEEEEAEGISGC